MWHRKVWQQRNVFWLLALYPCISQDLELACIEADKILSDQVDIDLKIKVRRRGGVSAGHWSQDWVREDFHVLFGLAFSMYSLSLV